MNCRHCGAPVTVPFVDLGSAPPSNAYLTKQHLRLPETWFPLSVSACDQCWLVQTHDYPTRDQLFTAEYAYYSSFSATWLAHAEQYVAAMVERWGLDDRSMVIEVGCNDGYLLQYVKARRIPCLGIEPTVGTASAARAKGLTVTGEFFGTALAKRLRDQGVTADLLVVNNVLAHVPDINDFVEAAAHVLKPAGVATFEFPHLLRMVQGNQFDTIYHEHFSYLSLWTVERVFARHGLKVFDLDELPTHGGSLRVYAERSDASAREIAARVHAVRTEEEAAGVMTRGFYENFQCQAERVKNEFLAFLIDARRAGRKLAGYGAAAKGNTLLNFAGIRRDLLPFVVDRNPAKQGQFLPGSRIPIVDEATLRNERPDYIVLFPWNLKAELMGQLDYARAWGAKFVTAVPQLEVMS